VIGVYDSGVGGLSVLRSLIALMPDRPYIYVADSGHGPYGERESAHVIERAERVTDWLVGRGIEALVVACNTATAVAVEQLRAAHPALPIIGVEPALKPAVGLSHTRRIGVMATRATLASSKFQRLLESLRDQAHFEIRACDGLAMAIERCADLDPSGQAQSELLAELRACAMTHLQALGPLGDKGVDVVVLGCTHYPLIRPLLQELAGPTVQLLDTGPAIARQTHKRLGESADAADPKGTQGTRDIELVSTGQAACLEAAARRWVGGPLRSTTLDLP